MPGKYSKKVILDQVFLSILKIIISLNNQYFQCFSNLIKMSNI